MSDKDPFDLRGQERVRESVEAAAKLERINEAEDWKWIMSNKRGRRLVWRWLARTGVFRSSFNHSGSVMAFNEGGRNVGLVMLEQINEFCPEHYLTMLTEQKQNE